MEISVKSFKRSLYIRPLSFLGAKALGTVIEIIILLLTVLAYYGAFEGIDAKLSQAQINIYNIQNENLEVTVIAYYNNVSHSDCGVGIGAYHGKALGIYKYNLSNITVTITNVGNVLARLVTP